MSVTHTFLGLPAALDLIFDKVPEDTLVLSSTSSPFERGTTFVKAAVPNGIMDRTDRLQGGWYGGRKSAVEWWERETMKVTRIQAGLQRCGSLLLAHHAYTDIPVYLYQVRCEGAAGVDPGRTAQLAKNLRPSALAFYSSAPQPSINRACLFQNMAERQGDCGPDMWFGFEYFADGRDCQVPAWVGPHYARLEGRQDQWNETMGVKGVPRSGL